MNTILALTLGPAILMALLAILLLWFLVAMAPAMTASTFYCRGQRVPHTNTGSAIAEGDLVVRKSGTTGCVGIAVSDIAATTGTGELEIEGVWTCPKASGEAFTNGQILYFNGTALTGTSTSTNTRAGRSVGTATSASTSCKCLLNAA